MKYKILKMIGKGSYAEVFLGIDNLTSQKVAIKRFYTKSNDIKNSFINEIKICKIITDKINCPYLIKMLDMYSDGTYTYLVLEYAPHGDLETYISKSFKKNRGINEKIIDRVILQVKEAISCLHNNNIIHRDIKSSNILIFDRKNVKISDFGVSKLLENNIFARSSIGTPYYMSPAIVRGDKYSYNVDYWALGCLIYKMVTNRYPFEAENLPKLVKKIKESKYNKYSIPDKYKKLIIDLLNPTYDKELLDIDLKRRNSEIEDFISYNCKTFINSPSNKYFKSKIFEDENDNESDSEEKEIPLYYNENKIQPQILEPINYNSKPRNIDEYLKPKPSHEPRNIDEYLKPKPSHEPRINRNNSNLPPLNPYHSNYNKQNEISREEKLKNFYKRKQVSPVRENYEIEKNIVHDIKVRKNRLSNNNPFRRIDYKVNNYKNINRNLNYGGQIFLEPLDKNYEKKNKIFIEKNFIKENKRNIQRIDKINNILKKNRYSNDQLMKMIHDTSLKKAPKNYLDNLKKNIGINQL